jgi:cytoskeleton protein RodZ
MAPMPSELRQDAAGGINHSVPTIGESLREARMRQHLDIADVEQKTKIRAKYLRALENEEFGMLPGPTFVKTFLRTYAEVLGLDPHRLVEQYRASYEPRDELDHLQPLGPAAMGRRRRGPRMRPGSLVVLALLGIVVALVTVGLLAENDGGQESADTATTRAERTAPRPERRRPQPAPRRVRLRIAPITPTYVCLDTGQGTPVMFEGILEEPQTFRGRRLRVNLGKTDVELRVNGRAVQLEPGPEPVGFDFRPRSTRPLPVGRRPCL